ncbi:PAS domain S-box protein [Geomonas sp. RF6]|uniref:PAS domain S-box protein n=1 Tax=Geomonas sp. RF6 TaxID=2897342 RepID=UPI001E583E44|nr:PAS domain S-box protein [Geomonas sp. RF6]UFS70081.1 PAS domain S-box protein [Geomonas sp. RF6]
MRGAGRDGRGADASGRGASGVVHLRLYLADNAPASTRALENVRAILLQVPPEQYTLKIVDALTFPAAALADCVFTTPALVRATEPFAVVTGIFAEPKEVLRLLYAKDEERLPAAQESEEARLALARRVTETKNELQALVGEGVDMVLDPAAAVPIILPSAQQAVHDDAQNFRRIFEEAPLGMALLSHDFTFLRINHRLSGITGLPPCELLKMQLGDLTGEQGGTAEELKLTGGRPCESGFCEGETLYRKKGGDQVWLRFSVGLVQHPREGQSYFLLMVQDVTGMRNAEAELLRYHSRLEDLVRERTAELAAANKKLMKEIEERLEAEDAVRALNEELEARVRERTAELEESNSQLETMNKFFVGRELRMAELKRQIFALEEEVRNLKQ